MEHRADDSRHPDARYVSPWKALLSARLGTDTRFVRGEGCYVYDAHGNRYLDFVAQYGALPFGFNPPHIWEALEQVRRSGEPGMTHGAPLDAAGALAERLIEIAPPGLRYVTFTNSGTEAAEAAIKVCRAATGRLGILSTTHGFHGMTLGALSASGHATLQQSFGAPVPHFHQVPYGDLGALAAALKNEPGYYAAFLVEPIQGKGGIVEPPPGYLAEAQDRCAQSGTLFVLDEVQTGLGRTGRMFACERDRLSPDVMILAKALGGGLMPIGACLYTQRAYSLEFDQRHSSTFAGNTLACRAGLATLELLTARGNALIRQVDEHGRTLRDGLERLRRNYPALIHSVRGRGFMLGLELNLSDDALGSGTAQPTLVQRLEARLLRVERIRVAASSAATPTLRLEPPLIAGREECALMLAALNRTFDSLLRGDAGRLPAIPAGDRQPGSTTMARNPAW